MRSLAPLILAPLLALAAFGGGSPDDQASDTPDAVDETAPEQVETVPMCEEEGCASGHECEACCDEAEDHDVCSWDPSLGCTGATSDVCTDADDPTACATRCECRSK